MKDFILFLINGPATLNDASLLPQITNFKNFGNNLVAYFVGIAPVIAMVFLAIGGYMYFTAGGNEEKLEKAKKTVTYSLVGLTLVLLTTLIVTTITGTFVDNAFNATPVQDLASKVWDYVRVIAPMVGVLFLIFGGYMYLTAGGNEEKLEKAKKTTIYSLVGLAVVVTSALLISTVEDTFGGEEFLSAPALSLGDQVVGLLIGLIMVVAVLFLIIAGYNFITAGGDEEKLTKAKKSITGSIIGLSVASLAYMVVSVFFQKEGEGVVGKIDAGKALIIIMFITKSLLSLAGILALAMIIVGGISYIISHGDEEKMTKAKKMLIGSITGLVVIIFAYTLVSIAFKI